MESVEDAREMRGEVRGCERVREGKKKWDERVKELGECGRRKRDEGKGEVRGCERVREGKKKWDERVKELGECGRRKRDEGKKTGPLPRRPSPMEGERPTEVRRESNTIESMLQMIGLCQGKGEL
ncbi:hypothetical protein niasHT_019640 [Heterodera trifolii]|uniref:Uncharacterized protein n=1 Tax=Heterodera trifolii TaxID=157864 RepID=A0ABD2L6F9_9BILA